MFNQKCMTSYSNNRNEIKEKTTYIYIYIYIYLKFMQNFDLYIYAKILGTMNAGADPASKNYKI